MSKIQAQALNNITKVPVREIAAKANSIIHGSRFISQPQLKDSLPKKSNKRSGVKSNTTVHPHIDSMPARKGRIYIVSNIKDAKRLPPTCVLREIKPAKCKLVEFVFVDTAITVKPELAADNGYVSIPARTPLMVIHGNIAYDYFYQSRLDTPFIGEDLQQHTITTRLSVLLKDQYPFNVSLSSTFGNSPYMRNFFGANLDFDQRKFTQIVKNRAENFIRNSMEDSNVFKQLSDDLDKKIRALKEIREWLYNPSITQKLVEARERYLARQQAQLAQPPADTTTEDWYTQLGALKLKNSAYRLNSPKSIGRNADNNEDSAYKRYQRFYNEQRIKADSIAREIDQLKGKLLSKQKRLDSTQKSLSARINSYRDLNTLNDSLKKIMPDSVLPKGLSLLASLRKLSIGTSTLDYSELSVKNITVTGLQVEINPKWYYAVAGGFINYRFRDYYMLNDSRTHHDQYLGIIRFGKGKPETSHLFLTYYFGKRNLYNYGTSADSGIAAKNALSGIALEQKIAVTDNISITAELAKSSMPYYNRMAQDSKLSSGAFNLNDRSNEAYSIKANVDIPGTSSRIDGYFKRYGENFQSFTMFRTNSRQTAWQIHLQQTLFQKQLTLNAAIRKNDFLNPFLDQQLVSNTVFKTLQATLRIKKLPVISLGYFPTTQIVKFSDEKYMEYLFNNLYGSVQYYYKAGALQMSSSITATKFYNRKADSNFVYYNAGNISFNQSVFLKTFVLQGTLSQSQSTNYTLHTCELGLQKKFKRQYAVGGSLKYNKQDILPDPQIGFALYGAMSLLKNTSIQLRVQKTYMPGPDRTLVPDNIGRVSLYQNF
ncbi:hypothetical protein [Parafilimonas terrae]|uniref:Uncharacterized protein n=1 Tax=Parafilimonas terrae TaxID=1465490 RepID=A0A1I5XGQ3_9BACT|nr:hypothetical protein [Parafilimonas terrae]SFQ31135.1 hypothetical protein SAMN05444277_108181 [Parafilimonas terrae]